MNRRRFVKGGLAASVAALARGNKGLGAYPTLKKKHPKIDTHIHIWDLEWFSYPWLQDEPEHNHTVTFAQYEEDIAKANVQKMIFVESGVEPEFGLEEVDWATAWAFDFPLLQGIIAQGDLSDPVLFPEHFERLKERHLVKGIRGPFGSALANPVPFIKNMHLLARSNLTLDLLLRPTQLSPAADLLSRCPAVPCVLDHMGNPNISRNSFDYWAAGIQRIAEIPHVYCKISGLLRLAGPKCSIGLLKPYVEFVIEQFGFDRLMYGSEWPSLLQSGTYLGWSNIFEELIKPYSDNQQEMCCRGTAEKLYRLS